MLVELMDKPEELEPVNTPLDAEVGNVAVDATSSVSVLPLIFMVPLVWVNAPSTVKLLPIIKV